MDLEYWRGNYRYLQQRSFIDPSRKLLTAIASRILILDEADRMLDMGFTNDIRAGAGELALTNRHYILCDTGILTQLLIFLQRISQQDSQTKMLVHLLVRNVFFPPVRLSCWYLRRHGALLHYTNKTMLKNQLVFVHKERRVESLSLLENKVLNVSTLKVDGANWA